MQNYENPGNYTVNDVLNKVRERYDNPNLTRYRSWEDCYNAFRKVLKKGYSPADDEYLALHLFGYVASWGMLRNSALMNQRYLVFIDLIPILFKPQYLPLFDVDEKNFEQNLPLIEIAYDDIEASLKKLLKTNTVSVTLVTKIMLGVYGCVPAYDKYFKSGVNYYGIQKNGKKIFRSLNDWLKNNPDFVKEIIEYRNKNFPDYPFMKVVDMYFWGLGYQIYQTNKNVYQIIY